MKKDKICFGKQPVERRQLELMSSIDVIKGLTIHVKEEYYESAQKFKPIFQLSFRDKSGQEFEYYAYRKRHIKVFKSFDLLWTELKELFPKKLETLDIEIKPM